MKQKSDRTKQLTQLAYNTMRPLMLSILSDLDKAELGNKAAAQRVRVNTIRLERVAKDYRKHSVISHRIR